MTNFTISTSLNTGVNLASGGTYGSPLTITQTGEVNATSGAGIYGASNATVYDAGTIIAGQNGVAVFFSGNDDHLVVDPGAVIVGFVYDEEDVGLLDLAAGSGAGTLSGLGGGAQFQGFNNIEVDAGATWTLTGATTLAAGNILSDQGMLSIGGSLNNQGNINGTNTGLLVYDPATIINTGAILATGASFSPQEGVTLVIGAVMLFDGGTLTNGYGGNIAGHFAGVNAANSAGVALTVTNSGLITGYAGNSPTGIGYYATEGFGLGARNGGLIINNRDGVISGSQAGVKMNGGTGEVASIDNAGLILSNGTAGFYGEEPINPAGVYLRDAGTVTNEASGTIAGVTGVYLDGEAVGSYVSYLDNFGTVTASADGVSLLFGARLSNSGQVYGKYYGVEMLDRDVNVTNQVGGTISGNDVGVFAFYPTGTGALVNAGLIEATAASFSTGDFTESSKGADMSSGGTLVNAAGGTIAGGIGVYFGSSGQLTNAGTILGNNGVAVSFNSDAIGLVVLDPGAVFGGNVVEANDSGTLELAGTARGHVSGLGAQFQGFTTIEIDTGATWVIAGTTAGLAGGEVIAGFTVGDTIILDGFAATGDSFVSGTGLELSGASIAATLDILGSLQTDEFRVSSDGTNTTIVGTIPCFSAGTRIATAAGEVAVERLKIGDMVRTVTGALRPVKWIGRRGYDGRFIAGNHLALPVRIAAGAIADSVPRRDLVVSPGHAIFAGGALVPAWRLINGVSITQAERVERVEYFHIELESHDVILAEGCPAESFYDEDFRAQFQNAAEFAAMYPQARLAAPVMARAESGFGLAAIWARIAARAGVVRAAAARGALHGFVDVAGPGVCSGWAQDVAAPEVPVVLDVFAGAARIGRVLANSYRSDLRAAGLGSGCHGFEFALPEGVTSEITVRRAVDGAVLARTAAAQAA